MKLLVIGNGGREHALAWKLAQSPRVQRTYVAPGNGGTARDGRLTNVPYDSNEALARFAHNEDVAFTVVGPEAPLASGVVDVFRARGLRIFGPTQAAAQLESSKDFAKALMARHRIPTAQYRTFTDNVQARAYARERGAPIVVKADGLAAGKGVVVAMTLDEANAAIDSMLGGDQVGARVVIEDFLTGEEASFIVMCDGKNVLPLASSQDHKRLLDDDRGPNTGGMGAYSPAPVVTPAIHTKALREVIMPAISGMAADGVPYTGFLYAGLMIAPDGTIKTLEFNCRMGDPEAQPIMLRLRSDLVPLLEAAIDGRLDQIKAEWDPRSSLGVVIAAAGYPNDPRKGDAITQLPSDDEDCITFHAGTVFQDRQLVTNGGRVLCVTALGETLRAAQRRAYNAVDKVAFSGMQFRRDIGHRALNNTSRMQMNANYTVEQHIALKRVSAIAPSPDGKWLAVAVQRLDRDGVKYVSDIWRVPTDGSEATQLTRGDSKDNAPAFRRDGALAFLSNRQPNEVKADEDADKRMQVWLLPVAGGEAQQLTDEPLGVDCFKFAKKADRLIVLAAVLDGVEHDKQRETARDREKKGSSARHFRTQPVRHWDQWLHENQDMANTHVIAYSSDGKNRVDLTPDAKREMSVEPAFDVTTDGRQVAVTWQSDGEDRETDTSIALIDVESKNTRVVGAGKNTNNESPLYSPNGKTVAVIRSIRSPTTVVRPTLTLIDVASGSLREVAKEFDAWPHLGDWSTDGKQIIAGADINGHVPVIAIDVASGRVERVTAERDGGGHTDLSVLADGRIAGIRSTFLEPPEAFVVQNKSASPPQTLARLSGATFADWVQVESVTAKSTDGADVQYFVMKPTNAQGRLPTLVWIHGGPIGMTADAWHWRWNPLLAVAQGYAVVQPNPRGSTGFGQPFVQGIWGNVWGDQCFKDLMAVCDAVAKRADVDADRMMAMGGSFGGYMTNWIGTQTQRFKCLITHACVTTMAQFTGTTDHPAWWYLEMGGEDPYADPSAYDRYAPIRHIKQWKTPALIIHGEKDYRCPIGEALNLFEALQYHGVPSEMLIFPDENHWILKPRNIVAWYDTVLAFIKRHLAPIS